MSEVGTLADRRLEDADGRSDSHAPIALNRQERRKLAAEAKRGIRPARTCGCC